LFSFKNIKSKSDSLLKMLKSCFGIRFVLLFKHETKCNFFKYFLHITVLKYTGYIYACVLNTAVRQK